MLKSQSPLRVQVSRGPLKESEHQVLAAFWHVQEGLIGFAGDPQALVAPRSAIKMLQALPLLESGAFDHFALNDQMLALACSSHHGEEIHTSVLREWMQKVDLVEDDLACGAHAPYSGQASEALIRQGVIPGKIHNNCSGKHLGFLTTSRYYKESISQYHRESHPSQRRIRKVLSEVMGIDLAQSPWGIDGCGIPTYGIPLAKIARGMSSLLDDSLSPSRTQAAGQILRACQRYPELVSGQKDWGAAIVRRGQGKILLKVGAEGVLCGLLPEHQVSFSLKTIDGNGRAVQAVAFEILKHYGILADSEIESLWQSTGGQLKNTLQEVVGEIRVLAKNN